MNGSVTRDKVVEDLLNIVNVKISVKAMNFRNFRDLNIKKEDRVTVEVFLKDFPVIAKVVND